MLLRTEGAYRPVATPRVGTLLGQLAPEHGAMPGTLTGFKWRCGAAAERPAAVRVRLRGGARLPHGDTVHDKDGLGAALGVALLLGELQAGVETVAGRLAAIYARHGLHASAEWSLRMDGLDGPARVAAAVDRLVASPPEAVAGRPVTAV